MMMINLSFFVKTERTDSHTRDLYMDRTVSFMINIIVFELFARLMFD